MTRIPIAAEPEHELGHPTHLLPLVRELVARGYQVLTPANPYDGFAPTKDAWVCRLDRPVADEDWRALREKFEIPPTINLVNGFISDDATWARIGVV